MSFNKTKEFVEENDTVILYLNPRSMHSLNVIFKIENKKGELVENVFQTKYGALKVSSLIGKKYGTRVEMSRGWGIVLQPTPELWTLTLPHRTQIIYTPDISLIIHLLDLAPGKMVIESGTGSGSLSHSLIRAVRPNGRLHTFDFHESRARVARAEFEKHGLDEFVVVGHRDVCLEGFGEELESKADAIFLDLPHPWLNVHHAVKALKTSGGKLCSFSPCIEQVQRTCIGLKAAGFVDIGTHECLQRELTVSYKNVPRLDLNFLKEKRTENEISMIKETEGTTTTREEKLLTATRSHSTPGHTGYITIATLPPSFARILPDTEEMSDRKFAH